MKNNKGITLIALVVTIIVLLILAGVSIAMLTGQNGILNKASQASYESKLSNAAESMSYNVTEAITAHYNKKYVDGTTDTTAEETPAAAIAAGINNSLSGTSGSYTSKADTSVLVTIGEGINLTNKTITIPSDGATNNATITLTYGGHKKVGTITSLETGITWSTITAE